jgi:argonaute-like protein implicated in RNA metabolism and viral defense
MLSRSKLCELKKLWLSKKFQASDHAENVICICYVYVVCDMLFTWAYNTNTQNYYTLEYTDIEGTGLSSEISPIWTDLTS